MMNTTPLASIAPDRAARGALALLLCTLLGACAVGPDYKRPEVPVPAAYKELPGWTAADPDAALAPKGQWWLAFHDPLLDELEPQVEVSNQTVRQSYANYQQALAEVKIARSALFPADMETRNPNLVGGDIAGGRCDGLRLLLRPVPVPVPYATPDPAIYLCSSATPPGPGVHGMCGYHAASAALRRVFGTLPPALGEQ